MTATLYPLSPSNVATAPAYHTVYKGVIDGDDISANAGQWAQTLVAAAGSVPALSPAFFLFGTNAVLTSVAVAGETVATMVTNAPSHVDALIDGTKTNFFVLASTYSADVTAGTSAATIAASVGTYGTGRKTAGFAKGVLVGPPPTLANTASCAALGALLKANFVSYGFDAYVDLLANAYFASPTAYTDRRVYLTDSTTLTPNGEIRYSDLTLTKIKAALGL